MAKKLSARPHLEHLRSQAKKLLKQLHDGDAAAARTFIDHLPAAKKMTPAKVRQAGFRLADAQSAVARESGFASWPALARHVQDLRGLEGEWHFQSLSVDGRKMAAGMLSSSRVLIDGDRFRTESPEAIYDGVFTIDVEASPRQIDIEFVEGPEAGNWSYGIYELDGNALTICLGLTGAPRPTRFATTPSSGHALEKLRRASAKRPAGVTGGTRSSAEKPERSTKGTVDASEFDGAMTPLLKRLQGEWTAIELNANGTPMQNEWLGFGSRVTTGNEAKVVFGGQTMVHAKMRFDEQLSPVHVDYLNLAGAQKGAISLGILEWIDDDVRFAIATPGQARPTDFTTGRHRTVSRWRRKT